MRGFPLINLLAVLAALTALLIPLLRLNTPARAVEPSPSTNGASDLVKVPVSLNLRFASMPLKVAVMAEGETLEFSGNSLERAALVSLPLREEALEFDVAVTWPDGAPGSVAELTVAPDGRAERKQNVWAEGAEASEILRFEWRK